jgi:hypothetical protein
LSILIFHASFTIRNPLFTGTATRPLPILLLSLVARLARGGLGGNRGGELVELQLATTDSLDTILFKGLVSCLIPVNTKDCDRVWNLGLADSFGELMYTSPNCIGFGVAGLVGIGNTGEPASGLLQYFQGIGDGLVVLHIFNVSELN